LESGADGCGEGVGLGGLLFASQEKQMVALDSIQIKDPCQALQNLCGNRNRAALLQALPQASYLTGNYLAVGGGNYLP